MQALLLLSLLAGLYIKNEINSVEVWTSVFKCASACNKSGLFNLIQEDF